MISLAVVAVLALALLSAPQAAFAQSRNVPPPSPTLGAPRPTFGSDPLERIRQTPGPERATPDPYDALAERQQLERARRDLQSLERRSERLERDRLDPLLERARTQMRRLDAELALPDADPESVRLQRNALRRDLDRLEHEYRQIDSPTRGAP